MPIVPYALSVNRISKRYGNTIAVDAVSFTVMHGEIVGLLGPNGAGKTTTINMILGVLAPSAGGIAIEGIDLAKCRSQALEHTNFAAVYAPLPGNLSVAQNLHIFGLLYGVKALPQRIDALLKAFDLERFRNTKCGVLSSGEQTRACLAKAMLNRPSLLLLDEPTASLDPATARDVRALVKGLAQGSVSPSPAHAQRGIAGEGWGEGNTGVLWTSHNMYEVEEVCDRVLFMSKGRILLEGNPKTLPGEYGKATLEELFITVAREPLALETV